ncbi:FAD-binding oxidoreductase [Rubrivirga sp. S365]|uniref:FAD-binding oxidoreductase n=1 Tax=Rubrivirga litoralis TaxID=3075598 RepID=A0ABU3BTX7_9BACT|nr:MULTISPECIES: FAD-binding oxidoreductase [unclassified Rubrivirga]MDT0632741.1 FAD-binding oxidoreductase [Rubrivirga sp. F394]MDT7856954.1 FAD-binding oxidoreductase [Rubrivirga sp. S365]
MPLPARTDVVVAGAGLAGACAALVLSRSRRVMVVGDGRPGASGAAAGLVNPFMGRKAKPAWRMDEALRALGTLLDDAGAGALVSRTGVVRPAAAPSQAATFQERAAEHAGALEWLSPAAAAERFPAVAAPLGALVVGRGGHVEVGALAAAFVRAAEARGAARARARLLGWRSEPGGPDADGVASPSPPGVVVQTDAGDVRARHLVLCLGDGARHLPALAALGLHRVKGQTVRLERPDALPPGHPAVAGRGYVVPQADAGGPDAGGPDAGGVVVGATFEHAFESDAPDPALDAGLVAQAAALVPALGGAAVLGRRAGVRLTVPAAVAPGRLPLAGPLTGCVWVFTGLGAKGLMTAPLLALALPDALDGRPARDPTLWRLPPAVAAALGRTGRGGTS